MGFTFDETDGCAYCFRQSLVLTPSLILTAEPGRAALGRVLCDLTPMRCRTIRMGLCELSANMIRLRRMWVVVLLRCMSHESRRIKFITGTPLLVFVAATLLTPKVLVGTRQKVVGF